MTSAVSPMVDPFGRRITYVRLSVTDRCDLRCVYCMAEDQTFLPKAELLTLEELDRLATAFVSLGVNRLRLTGGEPLVRRGVLDLIKGLGRHLRSGALEDLTLTTNGALLEGAADALASAGVKRINVSLDSLDPTVYQRLTRGGDLAATLRGIDAAARAGLKIKINIVALRHDNTQDLPDIIAWAHGQGHDVSLIETMPLGDIGADRTQQYVSLADVRAALSARWTFVPETKATPGPARYFRLAETGGSLGFITPLSHNFCESCNRVRVTCTGTLFLCLGQNDHADLRGPLRASADDGALIATIREAISRKPERHTFKIDGPRSAVARPMSMTGG